MSRPEDGGLNRVLETVGDEELFRTLIDLGEQASNELMREGYALHMDAPIFINGFADIGCDVPGVLLAYGSSRKKLKEKVKGAFNSFDDVKADSMVALLERIGEYNGKAAMRQANIRAEELDSPRIGKLYSEAIASFHKGNKP